MSEVSKLMGINGRDCKGAYLTIRREADKFVCALWIFGTHPYRGARRNMPEYRLFRTMDCHAVYLKTICVYK
ncbi:hypothetical protein MishRS11D_28180 [Methylomagnum ishizawai]|nr:hypothetical protein MishRS11D_28180 [Methylomagnum ishizawai]